jgi:transposase
MEVLYRCCCGIDVHKRRLSAHLLRKGVAGNADLAETRTFGTSTHELLALSQWLAEAGCTHVALESTGVYWKPVFNILEADLEVILANARHIKNVPGRKTDVRDCQWIAQLLQHGLIKASFIPPKEIRELRELTRARKKLIQQRATVVNRIQKTLEDANIKLASVASDVTGKSGWSMLTAIVAGETDPERLAGYARGRLKSKKTELTSALKGHITEHHRFLLKQLMREVRFFDEMIETFDERIEEATRPFCEELRLLDLIPGINRRAGECIIAELGVDMSHFPTHRHVSSWAGLCPGNNESAGKHRSGKTTDGNKWLRAVLTEAAWAASRTKHTYFSAHFHRIAGRRGKKRALAAVAHSLLVIVYHILRDHTDYYELGSNFFDTLNADRLRRYYTKRLESLGYSVALSKTKSTA